MASITKQHIGKYIYLYESVSYRDELGRPRNKKRKIGKIDTSTGEPIYTAEYMEERGMIETEANKAESIKIASDAKKYAETFLESVKIYGVYWFLYKIAEQISLTEILRQAFPRIWQEVFILACFLIASDKPVMYCEDWILENEWAEVGSMSSQRISELLIKFNESSRNQFYRAWSEYIQEREYLALDITSISSYSQQITNCEWGYNRDNENLPQINICMLHGERSRLPVFQTNYSGSLSDVVTLENTISEFRAIIGEREIMTVMDKGFYSAKNVNMLLEKNVKFLVSMSFTSKLAKQLINNERGNIDQIENVIVTSGTPIRGIHRTCSLLNSDKVLNAHIYFNPEKAVKDKNELYGHIAKLKELVVTGSKNSKFNKDIQKYLIIQKSETDEVISIHVRQDIVDKSLKIAGWFILLSNHIINSQEAYDTYRMKDVVEKSFWKYKNSLGLERLRVHTNERVENKTFVAFIALILSSHIHSIMREHQLYKIMTFDKLFMILAKIKSVSMAGQRFIRPLTKQIKDIFNLFQIPLPIC